MLVLLVAIRAVESANGVASKNQLQIREICVLDVNRIYGTSYRMRDVYDHARSREIAELYLAYWGGVYRAETGRNPDYEVFARIWNGGPDGWRKRSTDGYWRKIRREVIKEESRLKPGKRRGN